VRPESRSIRLSRPRAHGDRRAGRAGVPTQPYPYTAKGVAMTPSARRFRLFPTREARRARPMFWPYSMTELFIVSHGGSSWGSMSFSPRTNLLYVTARCRIVIYGQGRGRRLAGRRRRWPLCHDRQTRLRLWCPATETVTAYNPASGEVVWQHEHPSNSNISSAGNLVTGGDLIFQGSDTGEFCALDARNGGSCSRSRRPDLSGRAR